MKTALKVFMLLTVFGYLVFAVVTMSHSKAESICSGVKIVISDTTGTAYMNEGYISAIIAAKHIYPEGQKLTSINLSDIEKAVGTNPYVDSVLCYYTPNSALCVKVIPRCPVVRVIAVSGEEYYMDAKGKTMPVGDFDLDLCVATGNITRELAYSQLVPLAVWLDAHLQWKEEIQQVDVRDKYHLVLYPVTGNHRITLGTSSNLDDKFLRLATFYREGLDKVGWNKYSDINLSFADQVVCTRR